jgi:uncharacterized membrane protein
MVETIVWVLLGLGLTGIVSLVVWLGFLTQNKDNASEIRKNLGIVGGITAVLVGIFAVVSYIYFTVNPGYIPMFALILTFINLFLSTFAVASSSLSVVHS